MHSNKAPNRMSRMTPFLITVGLGLSGAAFAAEPESSPQPSDDMQSEIPAPTVDTDGDGLMDAWDIGRAHV